MRRTNRGVLTLVLAAGVLAQSLVKVSAVDEPGGVADQSPPATSDALRVTLLGTGVGPPVNLNQLGASTLVQAGNISLLFDCGRGATERLTQVGIPLGSIHRLFLTHLHSDHVIQIPDLLLTGWAGAGRQVAFEVWGPRGTVEMMDHLQQAFAFDIHMRRDIDEKVSGEGIRVVSHDIEQGVVFDESGVKVTAFAVDHGPVVPAFGYRIDYRGHSVALSGDTRPSENLIQFARGVDVLVHEAFDGDAFRASPRARSANPAAVEAVIAHHTTPEQAADVFNRVKPRLAVFSHAPNTEDVVRQTKKTYAGPLQGAEDMLTIVIGDDVRVEHHLQ